MATYESALRNSAIGDPNNPDTSASLRRCFALGLNVEQGISFREITGYMYPMPESGCSPALLIDSEGMQRAIALNPMDGRAYDISTRKGPINSNVIKARRDGEGIEITITGITLSGTSVVAVAATAHGLQTGDQVSFRDVGGTVELNSNYYTVTRTGAGTFTLDGTSSANFTAWTSGGSCFRAGLDITPEVELGEDTASDESKFVRMQKMHVFTRPETEDYRGDEGYDSNGYPDGLLLTAKIYKDGERTTPTSQASKISIPRNQVLFDKMVEGNRIKTVLSANMGEHSLTEVIKKYVTSDTMGDPDDIISTEQGYQAEFATPSLWLGVLEGHIYDRVKGETVAVTGATAITGPDGQTSGLSFTSAITLPSADLNGTGTVLIWYQGTIAVTIGGTAVSLTTHDTSGSWILGYANNVTASGAMVITPTGTGKIADVRAYDSAISADARDYYFDDVDANDGAIVL